MSEGHWFDEGIRILGWVLLMSAVFGAIGSGGAQGLALLAAIVAIFALNWLISTLVRAGESVCKLGSATLEAISKIRITFPKRPPTKKEIADWFLGEHQSNDEIIGSMPLGEVETNAGRGRNRELLVEDVDRLMEGRGR